MRSALAGLGALGLGIVLVTSACGSDDPSGGPAAGGSAGTGGTGGSDAAAGGSGGAAGDGSAGSGGSGGLAGGGAAGAGGSVAGDGGVCGPVGGSGTPCEKSCAKSLAAAPQGMCEVLDPALCKLRCEKQLAKYPTCAKESQAVVDCAANAGCFTCPFETPQLSGCEAERQAEAACTVCEHTPGESLCSYCGKNAIALRALDPERAPERIRIAADVAAEPRARALLTATLEEDAELEQALAKLELTTREQRR